MRSERVSIGAFLDSLRWLDGSPLRVEPYRRQIFEDFNAQDANNTPIKNLALCGRAKKNNKTLDAMIQALYCLFDESPQGSQVFVVANDEDQAGDDLDLLKKLIRVNPLIDGLVVIRKNVIERRDGRGFIEVLPAQDAAGAHGKTYRLLVCDEIHAWKDWDLLEALAPDPTRADAQTWITSYASIHHRPGVPLFDLLQQARGGNDPRFLFSWYAADFSTDPSCSEMAPELRANPSMRSWANTDYLGQQRRRLPSNKFRRLHLNLPGSPEGSAYQAEPIANAVDRGVVVREPRRGVQYVGFVDMSGGSVDDAALGISHYEPATGHVVIDLVMNQGAKQPFDPRAAVSRFARALQRYGVGTVIGDAYAGETFRADFRRKNISYVVSSRSKSEIYETFEPLLNSGRIRLVDVPQLEQQLLGLVWRGSKIDHQSGEHDDWANAVCGAACAADVESLRKSVAAITTDQLAAESLGPEVPTRNDSGVAGSRHRCGRVALASPAKGGWPMSSVTEELRRCAEADAERIRRGEQDDFLNSQGKSPNTDRNWRERAFDLACGGRAKARLKVKTHEIFMGSR